MVSKRLSKWSIGPFEIFNGLFMMLLLIIMLYPLLNVLAISLSNYGEYLKHPMMFFPRGVTFEAYLTVFKSNLLLTSYRNTLFLAVVGTAINVTLTVMTAYPLSKKHLKGRRIITLAIIFTMLFSGGIIPTYFVVKGTKLLDTLWSLIIPIAINTYYLIIMRSFFHTIPDSLEESAKIEGANDITILIRIILPVSIPAIVTITLFYAVANWNQFFQAILYIDSRSKWPLQILLREMILQATELIESDDIHGEVNVYPFTLRSATVMVVILPILFVYPFLQKYFMKGIMLGSVKG